MKLDKIIYLASFLLTLGVTWPSNAPTSGLSIRTTSLTGRSAVMTKHPGSNAQHRCACFQGCSIHARLHWPWCMPSRATMLTGIPIWRRVHEDEGHISWQCLIRRCPFWPRVFRKHGYTTAQIGKWHTGIDSGYGRWGSPACLGRPKFPQNGNYFDDQPFKEREKATHLWLHN